MCVCVLCGRCIIDGYNGIMVCLIFFHTVRAFLSARECVCCNCVCSNQLPTSANTRLQTCPWYAVWLLTPIACVHTITMHAFFSLTLSLTHSLSAYVTNGDAIVSEWALSTVTWHHTLPAPALLIFSLARNHSTLLAPSEVLIFPLSLSLCVCVCHRHPPTAGRGVAVQGGSKQGRLQEDRPQWTSLQDQQEIGCHSLHVFQPWCVLYWLCSSLLNV